MTTTDQLRTVRDELGAVHAEINQLAARVTDAEWTQRPKTSGWSAAECITHLTMTTDVYIPLLNAARATVAPGAPLPAKYRKGFGGWLLATILEPPARMRSRTIPAFIPAAAAPKAETIAAFARSQASLLAWIGNAQNVALNEAMVTSPFNARLRYNAYSALCVLAAHQRRHAWQAERAVRGI